jgi:hypothetical protein
MESSVLNAKARNEAPQNYIVSVNSEGPTTLSRITLFVSKRDSLPYWGPAVELNVYVSIEYKLGQKVI